MDVKSPAVEVEEPEKERLNNAISVTVALLAAFMSVTKIKDDNLVQAMQQAKVNAVDTWGEYQAKKLKHHLAELGINQLNALELTAPPSAAARLEEMRQGYQSQIQRYVGEEKTLMEKAKDFEREYDRLNLRDDQFDLSDAALSISLGVLAVAALASRPWLLIMAWGFGALGLATGLAAIFRLPFHPDWLVRWLS